MASALNILVNALSSVQSSYVTASVTLYPKNLYLFSVMSLGDATIPTVTGAGQTWVQVASKIDASNTRKVTTFRAVAGAEASGALTIDFGGNNQTACAWILDKIDGVDILANNGATAIVQTATAENTGTQTGITVTFSTPPLSGNSVYGAVRKSDTVPISPGTNFTELAELTNPGANETEFQNSNVQNVDWTWASTSATTVALAIELAKKIPATLGAHVGEPGLRGSFF